mgnify:CR=1 FL=1
MKQNLIMICIDGCRFDRAENSKFFTEYLPGTNFCSQSITYAPYTNSSIHAVFSGSYGNRNGCYSYWHSLKFKTDKFKTITKYLKNQNYYTHADIHSKLAIPLSDFDEFEIYDENNSDLISRHKNLIKSYVFEIFWSKNNQKCFLNPMDSAGCLFVASSIAGKIQVFLNIYRFY